MEEMHVLLKNRGKINPRSSQEYADRGGFEALKKALSMDSEAIIDVIRASGTSVDAAVRDSRPIARWSLPPTHLTQRDTSSVTPMRESRVRIKTGFFSRPTRVRSSRAWRLLEKQSAPYRIYLSESRVYIFVPGIKRCAGGCGKTRIFRKKYDGERF